jgi:hypothetical protein
MIEHMAEEVITSIPSAESLSLSPGKFRIRVKSLFEQTTDVYVRSLEMAVDPGRGYQEILQRKRKTISTDHFSPLPGLASSVTNWASIILRCAVS